MKNYFFIMALSGLYLYGSESHGSKSRSYSLKNNFVHINGPKERSKIISDKNMVRLILFLIHKKMGIPEDFATCVDLLNHLESEELNVWKKINKCVKAMNGKYEEFLIQYLLPLKRGLE